MDYFQNKRIWITGASSGIGKAIALELAKSQSHLVISARRKNTLEKFSNELLQSGAASVHVLAFDLEKEEERENAILELRTLWVEPDIMILSGGLSQRSLILETELAVFRRLMEVDYLANVHLSKAFLKEWQTKPGQIAIISSLVGKIPTPYRSGYAAAKHALHGYFDSLRAEHPQLKVNIICPGFIHTQVSVNALKGDNSPLGEMDRAQAEGMDPKQFARKALRSMQRNRAISLIGGKEVWGVHLHRFFPGLFRRLIAKVRVR